ncbi:MAG: CsbD family protein [Planctomycetales bacterium]
MLNAQQLEGHWTELTGRIKERWGALTDNDLGQAEGDVDQLVGLIQRKTGEARSNIEDFLEEVSAECSTAVERMSETARAYAGQASDTVRQTYDDVSRKMQDRYVEAEEMVKAHPAQSVAVAFGTGLIAGVIVGLVLRPR